MPGERTSKTGSGLAAGAESGLRTEGASRQRPCRGAGGREGDGRDGRQRCGEAAAVATRFPGPSPELGAQQRAAGVPATGVLRSLWLPGPRRLRSFAQPIHAGFLRHSPSGPLETMAQVPLQEDGLVRVVRCETRGPVLRTQWHATSRRNTGKPSA